MIDLLLTIAPYVVTLVLGYLGGLLITWHQWHGRFIRPAIARSDRNFTIVVAGVMTVILYQVMTGWIASTRTEACQIATADVIRDNVEAARALGGYAVQLDALTRQQTDALNALLAAPPDQKDAAAGAYAEVTRIVSAEWSAITDERAQLIASWPPLPDRLCEHA